MKFIQSYLCTTVKASYCRNEIQDQFCFDDLLKTVENQFALVKGLEYHVTERKYSIEKKMQY